MAKGDIQSRCISCRLMLRFLELLTLREPEAPSGVGDLILCEADACESSFTCECHSPGASVHIKGC